MPLHTSFSTVPKRFLIATLTGSIASYHVPRLQVCQDINSSLKWSRTPKNQYQPMSSTKNYLPSVPHNRSGFPWTIFPSYLRTFTVALSWRYGLSNSFSRHQRPTEIRLRIQLEIQACIEVTHAYRTRYERYAVNLKDSDFANRYATFSLPIFKNLMNIWSVVMSPYTACMALSAHRDSCNWFKIIKISTPIMI